MLILSRFTIHGHSMEPTILSGQIVLVSNIPFLFFRPKINEIISFKHDGKVFIKRIVKVNKENYFVKGDNEKDSFDSRKVGWIKRQNIIGKVIT